VALCHPASLAATDGACGQARGTGAYHRTALHAYIYWGYRRAEASAVRLPVVVAADRAPRVWYSS